MFLWDKVERLFKNGQNIVRAQNLVVLVFELDFGAAVLADQHTVALLDFEGDFLAVIIGFAGTEGNDDAFGGFLFGGIGDDDPALLDFAFFGGFDQNLVA